MRQTKAWGYLELNVLTCGTAVARMVWAKAQQIPADLRHSKTRDCQEVLCRKKAKNMREDLT